MAIAPTDACKFDGPAQVLLGCASPTQTVAHRSLRERGPRGLCQDGVNTAPARKLGVSAPRQLGALVLTIRERSETLRFGLDAQQACGAIDRTAGGTARLQAPLDNRTLQMASVRKSSAHPLSRVGLHRIACRPGATCNHVAIHNIGRRAGASTTSGLREHAARAEDTTVAQGPLLLGGHSRWLTDDRRAQGISALAPRLPTRARLRRASRSPYLLGTISQSLTKTFIMRPSTRPRTVTRSPFERAAARRSSPDRTKHWTTGISNILPVPTVT